MLAGYFLTVLCTAVAALPSRQIQQTSSTALGVQWPSSRRNNKALDELPLLNVGYQTYRASRYDSTTKIYTFKNIRYAAAPVGPLRWAMPAPPPKNDTIADGEYGPICAQPYTDSAFAKKKTNAVQTNSTEDIFIGDEDCLFLDLYVPEAAMHSPNSTKLPVIVWIFGGGYFMGNKDSSSVGTVFYGDKARDHSGFDYDGSPIIEAAEGKAIFVAGNYRLGAFGFLAGSTVERDGGLPNAGLFDQRAMLQWVQDNIYLVGGDKKKVSAWGESAGGGSIINHLVLKGGTMDPLFSKAIVQSGAHPLIWDRSGMLDERYKVFEKYAGCTGKGVECLRSASTDVLRIANVKADRDAPAKGHIFSIAPDGNYIRQIAPLEFQQGNYWKGLKSLVISHVEDEAVLFIPDKMKTENDFMEYVTSLFPGYLRKDGPLKTVSTQYPAANATQKVSRWGKQFDRARLFIRDSTFTCQARWLTEAYPNSTWAMKYSVGLGLHATDLLATFQKTNIVPSFPAYKSYLASHAVTGNPNTLDFTPKSFLQADKIFWPKANATGEMIAGVLDVNTRNFKIIDDDQDVKSKCDFWREFLLNSTRIGGYSAPPIHLS